MEIETIEDLAEKVADWLGIYGGCKGDGDDGCLYEEKKGFCCRQGFTGMMQKRIAAAVENDKRLNEVSLK